MVLRKTVVLYCGWVGGGVVGEVLRDGRLSFRSEFLTGQAARLVGVAQGCGRLFMLAGRASQTDICRTIVQ